MLNLDWCDSGWWRLFFNAGWWFNLDNVGIKAPMQWWVWPRFWSWTLIKKSSHSGQILGLLCLWQCLYFPLFWGGGPVLWGEERVLVWSAYSWRSRPRVKVRIWSWYDKETHLLLIRFVDGTAAEKARQVINKMLDYRWCCLSSLCRNYFVFLAGRSKDFFWSPPLILSLEMSPLATWQCFKGELRWMSCWQHDNMTMLQEGTQVDFLLTTWQPDNRTFWQLCFKRVRRWISDLLWFSSCCFQQLAATSLPLLMSW